MRNLLAKFLLIALIVVGVLINSEPVQAAYAEAGVYTPLETEWTRTYNNPGYNYNLSIAPPAGQAIIGFSVTANQAYTYNPPLFYAYPPSGQSVYISSNWEVAGLTRYVRCQNPITTSAHIYVYNPSSPVLPFVVNIHYGVPVADGDEVTAAKTAALAAQTAANNALTKINNTTYGLEAINNKINNSTYGLSAINNKINNLNTKIESLSTPVITKVSTANGATASTTGVSPTIVITASGADMFDLSRDGTWIGGYSVTSGGSISIASGINNIQIRAYDSTIPEDKRKYGYGNILIFGL